MMRKARFSGLVTAAALLVSTSAFAQQAKPLDTWLDTCQENHAGERQLKLTRVHQLSGLAVIGIVAADGADNATSYTIEVTHPPRQPFVTENGVGLSPVGEFANWANAPATLRAGLDVLVECSSALGAPSIAGVSGNVDSTTSAASPGGPWRLLLGLLFAGFAWILSRLQRLRPPSRPPLYERQEPSTKRHRAADLAALLLIPATFLFRLYAVPIAYLHQNGQGPLWVHFALGAPTQYGPGYAQLYGGLLNRVSDPDGVLFMVHALAGALVPYLLYRIARFAGAGRGTSLVLALAAATSPAFGRVAQSESYFSPTIVLLTAAGAVLAMNTAPRHGWWRFVLGTVAAGLFISQAALIHPVGWLPAAFLPLCVLVAPGPLSSRLERTVITGLGIGLVVAVTSGFALLEVLQGDLGQRWLNPESAALSRPDLRLLAVPAIALALTLVWPRLKPSALGITTLVLVFAILSDAGLVLSQTTPALQASHLLMGTPVLVAALASALAPLRGGVSWAAAAMVLAATLSTNLRTWDQITELPTDALEGQLALEWRELIPEGSRFVTVSRAEQYVVTLPIRPPTYSLSNLRPPRESEAAMIPELLVGSFYYRPALCSSSAARSYCEQVEAAHHLEPLWNARLPSRPSISNLVFEGPEVEVALFRVKGAREAELEGDVDDGLSGEEEALEASAATQ